MISLSKCLAASALLLALTPSLVAQQPVQYAVFALDRSGSMSAVRGNGQSRGDVALAIARDDVDLFFQAAPNGRALVLDFSGVDVRELTNGFVGRQEALAALQDRVAPVFGQTPLAHAVCTAVQAFQDEDPNAGPDRRSLFVYSDGDENSSGQDTCRGGRPAALNGTRCPNQPVAGDPFDAGSWQAEVCDIIEAQIEFNVYLFGFFGLAPVDGETFLTAASSFTGGFFQPVDDNDDDWPRSRDWRHRGTGCPDPSGQVSTLLPAGEPRLGQQVSIDLFGTSQRFWNLALGFSDTDFRGASLPLDLGFLGATGCVLRTSMDDILPARFTNTTASYVLTLPLDTALDGLEIHMQGLVRTPGQPTGIGYVLSEGLTMRIRP